MSVNAAAFKLILIETELCSEVFGEKIFFTEHKVFACGQKARLDSAPVNQQFVPDHRDYILREMSRRSHRRPFYSQRAMARDLHLAPSTLTDFLKGRMGLSPGRVAQLSKILGLNGEQCRHWNDLIAVKFSRKEDLRKASQIRVRSRIDSEKNSLTLEQFRTISEWQHLALMELIEMDAAKYSQISAAAKALGTSLNEMKSVFHRLEDQGFIHRQADGKMFQVSSSTQVGNGNPSEAIRKFQQDVLTKALQALQKQPLESRYFTSAFVGLTQDQVQKVREALKHLPMQFFDPYLAEKSSQSKDQLYAFSLQFFSLLSSPQERS